MISIEKFCKLHNACPDGRDWALANCKTMADVWATARPDWLVWVATRPGVMDDRMLRLFAVDCALSVEYLLTDDRSRRAIDVAERFAHGDATLEELQAAWGAAVKAVRGAAANVVAWAAACDAASDAAWAAAWAAGDAAWAAGDAAWAAGDAAWAAALAAASAAASAAAWAAAWDAAWERQAIWLRQHCTPNFSMGGE